LCAPRYDFAAASVNYGEVPDDAVQRLRGACPIVASYGRRDRTLRGRADRLEQAKALSSALMAGDPDAGRIIKQSFKQKVEEFLPGR